MWLIVGLGNPGDRYVGTRHNAGFMVVEQAAARAGLQWNEKYHRSLVARGRWAGSELVLARPQTYMNLSGEAVSGLVKTFRVDPSHLLVVHDDLDLDFGRLRIRPRGGSGGHRGVESIILSLDTEDFPRLRFGIGRPPAGVDSVDYVLFPFLEEERELAGQTQAEAVNALGCVLTRGLEPAMTRYNSASRDGPQRSSVPPGKPAGGAAIEPGFRAPSPASGDKQPEGPGEN